MPESLPAESPVVGTVMVDILWAVSRLTGPNLSLVTWLGVQPKKPEPEKFTTWSAWPKVGLRVNCVILKPSGGCTVSSRETLCSAPSVTQPLTVME